MKVFIFLLSIFLFNIYANDRFIDDINIKKVKKLIKKEELLASAYKKYILKEGNVPIKENGLTVIDKLKSKNYLPNGFDNSNLFSSIIQIVDSKMSLKNSLPKNLSSNITLYNYYYSNQYRKHTKAPFSKNSKYIFINFSSQEKFIIKNKDIITKDLYKAQRVDKITGLYYLDEHSVLHWYDKKGEFKFAFSNNLIVSRFVKLIDTNNKQSAEFKALMKDKGVLKAGQEIFHMKENSTLEYLNLNENNGLIETTIETRELAKATLQFTRRAGAMLINGDIYVWGNSARNSVSVKNSKYKDINGNDGKTFIVFNSLVRALTNDNTYLASPLRTKFVDFTSDVFHGTCGISTKGELFCAGPNTLEINYIDFIGYNRGSNKNMHLLHKSRFFDGENRKAKRVFSLFSTWLVLSEDGRIYYWGTNHTRHYNGHTNTYTKRTPTEIKVSKDNVKVLFDDITYSLTPGFRRVAALSKNGDIYTWGLDSQSTGAGSKYCQQKLNDNSSINLCIPTKLQSDIKFTSIRGGMQNFILEDENKVLYKLSQERGYKAKVEKIHDLIKQHTSYTQEDDTSILSVDISSKLKGGIIHQFDSFGKGIVWINSKNQLKGDYFTAENKDDEFFKEAINRIKWKTIKVIEDENGLCGIDIYNQMYCWGVMSFYASANSAGNTLMLPLANANLHDLDKDFLFVEGGTTVNESGQTTSKNVTPITSGEWTKQIDGKNAYFIKYPTYIGGFNYEFTFK